MDQSTTNWFSEPPRRVFGHPNFINFVAKLPIRWFLAGQTTIIFLEGSLPASGAKISLYFMLETTKLSLSYSFWKIIQLQKSLKSIRVRKIKPSKAMMNADQFSEKDTISWSQICVIRRNVGAIWETPIESKKASLTVQIKQIVSFPDSLLSMSMSMKSGKLQNRANDLQKLGKINNKGR